MTHAKHWYELWSELSSELWCTHVCAIRNGASFDEARPIFLRHMQAERRAREAYERWTAEEVGR